MPLQLASEEPEAGPWRTESLSVLAQFLTQHQPGTAGSRRPVIVAIDGRSNSGKTSLAARLAQAVLSHSRHESGWNSQDQRHQRSAEQRHRELVDVMVGRAAWISGDDGDRRDAG